MLGDKLRLRFSKTGTLRLLSHHDLMRCFERMLRRAELPFKSTNGFHPTPRVHFALSLPLGVEGLDEVVEIELTEEQDAEQVLAKLNAQSPVGLAFTRVSVVPMKSTAIPRRVAYSLELSPERADSAAATCRAALPADKIWVERHRPTSKRLNIRPYIRNLSVSDNVLSLDFWVTNTGTARADELLSILNLTDVLEAGAVLRRTAFELRDEITQSDPPDQPPDGPAETLPLPPAAARAAHRDNEFTPAAHLEPMVE
jgi:radical SAM-linked protein